MELHGLIELLRGQPAFGDLALAARHHGRRRVPLVEGAKSYVVAALAEELATPTLVVEPGQFGRRGGIVDVFSPSDSSPIRIEFFGDEIESVGSFDPLTQRSKDQLGDVRIWPATELFAIADQAMLERLAGLDGSG